MGLARHKMILLSGEVRYAHGLLVGGSTEGFKRSQRLVTGLFVRGRCSGMPATAEAPGRSGSRNRRKKKNKLLT